MSEGAPAKRSPTRRVLSFVVLALVAWGIASLVVRSCETNDAIGDTTRRFLRALRAGDAESARALMTVARRESMSTDELAALTDHPAFRAPADVGPIESWGDLGTDEACVDVTLNARDGEWAAQLYLREEDDRWRVESLAIQPPAPMQLGDLLPECGYWEGSRLGYHGPPIERATEPLRRVD